MSCIFSIDEIKLNMKEDKIRYKEFKKIELIKSSTITLSLQSSQVFSEETSLTSSESSLTNAPLELSTTSIHETKTNYVTKSTTTSTVSKITTSSTDILSKITTNTTTISQTIPSTTVKITTIYDTSTIIIPKSSTFYRNQTNGLTTEIQSSNTQETINSETSTKSISNLFSTTIGVVQSEKREESRYFVYILVSVLVVIIIVIFVVFLITRLSKIKRGNDYHIEMGDLNDEYEY